jgi:mono/diheme cytochrome c family protein
MNAIRICLGALLLASLLAAPLLAATEPEDVFAFVPDGGRTLLVKIMHSQPGREEARALLTGKRTREEWVKYLRGHTAAVPALKVLDEKALATLADYLAFHMPLPAAKVPADLAKADWPKLLPQDGRDLTLENCQFCHIITVVVTQDRPQAHWLGTMNKPSHVEIELNPRQREELANYLELNGGIPIDLVPEDLRAGGASY